MLPMSPGGLSSRVGVFLIVLTATAVPAANLSESYGFGPMEILKLDWEIGPLLTGDLNGDSLHDLVLCNNRKSCIELLLQKPNFDPRQAVMPAEPNRENINDVFGRESAWRFQRFHYPLHVRATSLVLGDFNHDERLDLAYYSADGLHVVLQDSSSPRSSPSAATEPAWQVETRFDVRDALKIPEALEAGDLNHDRRTDLVLLLQDGYYVLLQTSDGHLAPPVRYYSSSENLRRVDVGDMDGDGRNDLVLLTGEQEGYPLRIRLQHPDGTLGAEGRYPMPAPSVLRLCHLDDSPRQVIASVSQPSGRFSLHALVRETQTEEAISIHPLPADDDAAHRDATCADIDGDGLTDMVVTDPGRGQPGSGLGPVTAYPGLKDMRKVRAARLGDGANEALVVLSIEEKLIALSRFADGRLSFPQTIPVTGEPLAMEIADLNGDGQADLAYVAKGPVPSGKKPSASAGPYFLRSVLSVGRAAPGPGPVLELTGLNDKPQDLLGCDIDHDGDMDLIVVRSYDPLLLARQTDAGVFAQQADDQTQVGLVSNLSPRAISLAPLGPQGRVVILAARGDFARSVCFDAAKGWQVIDQYQAGDKRHQLRVATAVPLASGAAVRIAAHDDASGILSLLDRQTDGTYRLGKEINVGTAPVRKILTGHFSSNASLDLVLCAERKLICVRDSSLLKLRQVAGFEPSIEDGRFGACALGDVNSDGVPDIVLCEQNKYHLQILSFDENAKLVDAYKFKVFEAHPHGRERQPGGKAESGEPRSVLVQDLTGDGKNDLAVLVHDRIIVYPQD